MDIAEELAGAKATIHHMSQAMSWISGHDRQGLDHLHEAMHFAAQLDAITTAHKEYEAALKQREHGGVAADKFIRAVAAVLDDWDEEPLAPAPKIDLEAFARRQQATQEKR